MAFRSNEKTIAVSEFERNDSTQWVQAMIGTLKEMIDPFVDDFDFKLLAKSPFCGLPKISFVGGIMLHLYSYGKLVQYLILHGYPSASSCGI
jgi:hypothetical protein